jgi:hypothetical protein
MAALGWSSAIPLLVMEFIGGKALLFVGDGAVPLTSIVMCGSIWLAWCAGAALVARYATRRLQCQPHPLFVRPRIMTRAGSVRGEPCVGRPTQATVGPQSAARCIHSSQRN